ncbi:PEP-CTERM sorting domain-containing protein [Botrimarina sp.]|uniref:PEP-CTERM sorting domain-containing protein n=1 Tax=Botrimarina sp. TaxID=2795802 RepID=UPI0032EC0EF1
MKALSLLTLSLCLALAPAASAATLFYDFGDSNNQTPGNYNQIVVNPPGQLELLDSIDSTGASTGIAVSVSGFFNGSNQSGPNPATGDAGAIFAGEATADNAFGHAGEFGTNPLTPEGTVAFTGLDGSGLTTYDFTIFASRLGATNVRDALYEVTGANSGSAVLDASGNEGSVVTVSGIIPTASGEITLTAEPGPNNDSSQLFYYLGALRVESNPIPEPTTLALVGLLGVGIAARRR